MADPHVDIAALAGDSYDDAWQAMAESYATVGVFFAAVMLKTGPVNISGRSVDRASGFVVTFDPLPAGGWRVQAVPRDEAVVADPNAADRLRAKWERQYERRA